MNARVFKQHLFLVMAAIGALVMPARAVPPEAESRTVEVIFGSDFNDNEIVLGQGAGLTFRVLISALYGETKDVNNNPVYVDDPSLPYTLPLDASNRAILRYKHSGVTNIAEPDAIVFEVENAAGEVSGGVVQVDVKLNSKVEIFSDDPRTNPNAILLGSSTSMDEEQDITIDTDKIVDDSNSPSDFRTLWTKASDATGRVSYASGDYLIDNTPPQLAWVRVPTDNATVKGDIEFELQATDNIGIGEVRFTAPNSDVSVPLTAPSVDQNWIKNFDTRILADRLNPPYQFKFEVVDLVSRAGAPQINHLRVDNTAPVIGDISLPDNGSITSLTEITIPVGDGTVEILVDGIKVSHVLTPPSTYAIVPPVTEVGEHDVTIRVTDGPGNVTEKTIHVTITGNRAPVAVADVANTTRDQFVDIQDVLANDTDLDGDTLTLQSVGTAQHGTVVIRPNRVIRYTPETNFTGSDTFTYVVSDGKTTATGSVSVGVSAGTNRAPTANSDSATTDEDVSKDIDVLANDTDLDGDTLSVSAVGSAAKGTVTINPNKTVRYTPTPDTNGLDTFTYTLSDGQGHLIIGNVTVTVTPVDDSPRVSIDETVLDNPNISGTLPLDIRTTDDGSITKVVVIVNNGTPTEATPNDNGGYDFILNTAPLPDGNNTITIVVTDDTGHETRDDVIIDVDNTPLVTTPTLNTGAVVEGTHVIDVDPVPGTDLDRVEIFVDGILITTLTGEPYDHSWDTTGLSDGEVDVVIRATDDQGNESTVTRIVNIDNTPNEPTEPEIIFSGGNPDERIGKGEVTLTIVGDGITDVVFIVDGVPHTATPVPPNRDEFLLDTTKLPDGPHTIYATYIRGGTPHDTPIVDYTVDNRAPSIFKRLPTQEQLDRGLAGFVKFRVEAVDFGGGPVHHVNFSVGASANPIASPGYDGDSIYEFTFDTKGLPDGEAQIFAKAYDNAGNPSQGIAYSFKISNDNPPPAGYVIEHPKNGAFITGDDAAKIYLEFQGEAVDVASINDDAIIVKYTKDGQEHTLEKLGGGAVIYEQQTGRLVFTPIVPDNSIVDWSVNVLSVAGTPYTGKFRFTRAMARSTGGTVTSLDRRFKLVIPEDALPSDMLVTVIDEQATQGLSNPALGNFESVNPGQSIVAGPFIVRGVDKDNVSVQAISRAASCSYSVPAAQDDQNSPKVFQLAELFDNGKVFPLGSAGARHLATVGDEPVGTRTIDVPISRFGRFIITSQVMPEAGLSHFYNFPNPFNPSQGGTDFHYFLGADSSVKIVIYDLFGQEVRNFDIAMGITGGKLGLNLFTWDGRNGAGEVVANGGYIARVLAEDAQGNRSKSSYKVGVLK